MRFVHRWRRDAALPLSKKALVNRSTKHAHCVDDERTIVLEFHQKERKLNSQLKKRNTKKLKDLSQLQLATGYQSWCKTRIIGLIWSAYRTLDWIIVTKLLLAQTKRMGLIIFSWTTQKGPGDWALLRTTGLDIVLRGHGACYCFLRKSHLQ